ncbi:MAG: PilN domain-containing protein [Gammaproteobacteria bacterium]|nr:PilN domain-containing protein [Gammaproteobacteria bacterium]
MKLDINLAVKQKAKRADLLGARSIARTVAVVLFLVSITYGFSAWSVRNLELEIGRLDREYASLTEKFVNINDVIAKRPKNTDLELRVRQAEHLVKARHRVQQLIQTGGFGNSVGFSAYFIEIARKIIPGMWITGVFIDAAGNQVTMNGSTIHADLVPRYIGSLGDSAALTGTNFSLLKMARASSQPGTREVDFSLTTADPDQKGMATASVN